MLVELRIGRYAGEVRNMAPHVARELIASGRALDVRSEPVAPEKGPPVKPEPPENVVVREGSLRAVPKRRNRKR